MTGREQEAALGEASPRVDPCSTPSGPDVRVGSFAAVPALLREAGCDPEAVLMRCGLSAAIFADPDHRIPFATGGALLDECARATAQPHFGLLAGCRFEFEALGVLAHLMRDAESVHAALLSLVRHLHQNDRGAVPFLLDLGQDEVALGYAVYRHDMPGIAQIYDLALAIGCAILRALCGSGWKPLAVTFSRAAPANVAAYRRLFGAPVRFDSPHSEIVFSADWLTRPIAGADAVRRLEAERIAMAHERGRGRVTERVQRVVHGLVMTGDTNARRIADLMGLHDRALRRRLEAEGTSVQEIINAARFDIARQLLRETRLPLAEIASSLHYSDATAFSRAFRGWAGVCPRSWRAQTRGTENAAARV